jgi:bifunctional DNA-binding transcriptional regulator/antitoxin component of YhaV-PrlF toxin-antitoxin module
MNAISITSAPISSQGQVTFPMALRRKLNLGRTVQFEEFEDRVVVKRKPTVADIRAAINSGKKGGAPISAYEMERGAHIAGRLGLTK